jgi:hypothetical protein
MPHHTLGSYRYFMYNRTIARQNIQSKFDMAVLPPTRASSRQNFLRVYLQVQEWRGVDLPPTQWG